MSTPVLAGLAGSMQADADVEIARLTLLSEILRSLGELGLDEIQVAHEVIVGLVRGRAVYGALDAVYDRRDWHDEADQEARDLAVYLGAEVVRRRRRKEHR
jgi:hypothetical protein